MSETATVTAPKVRVRHNLNNEEFAKVYSASQSARQVAEELKVPINVVNSRASYLRRIGVQLKHFDAKKKRINVAALNAVVTAASSTPAIPEVTA